jgi:hypothetical protein
MNSDIEKDYDTLCEEMEAHVAKAIQNLKDAVAVCDQIKSLNSPRDWDCWEDLREVVKLFLEIPDGKSWNSSSWCMDG